MGRASERPRLTAALVLVIVLVAGAGVLIGTAIGGDDSKVPAATQARLDRAERSAARSAGELKSARADAGRSRQAAARADRRARDLRARNRRLRRALTRVRRSLARARR